MHAYEEKNIDIYNIELVGKCFFSSVKHFVVFRYTSEFRKVVFVF